MLRGRWPRVGTWCPAELCVCPGAFARLYRAGDLEPGCCFSEHLQTPLCLQTLGSNKENKCVLPLVTAQSCLYFPAVLSYKQIRGVPRQKKHPVVHRVRWSRSFLPRQTWLLLLPTCLLHLEQILFCSPPPLSFPSPCSLCQLLSSLLSCPPSLPAPQVMGLRRCLHFPISPSPD